MPIRPEFLDRLRSSRESLRNVPIEKKIQFGGFILSIILAIAAGYEYFDTKEKEFKKAFYEERLKVYGDLSETIARIVRLPDGSKARSEAVQHYWELFFGKAQLLADGEVMETLRSTGNWIVFCVEKKGHPPSQDTCNDVAGNAHAMAVGGAARNSLVKTWRVPLEKLGRDDLYARGGQ